MKTKLLIALGFLVLVPLASGQSAIGQQEDFEDDPLGGDPSAAWYAFTEPYTDGATSDAEIITPGYDSTNQAFQLRDLNAASINPDVRFTLVAPQQFSNMTYYYAMGGGINEEIFIEFTDSLGRIIESFRANVVANGASGCNNAGNCIFIQNFGAAGTTVLIGGTQDWTDSDTIKFRFDFNWVAKTFIVNATRISTGATVQISVPFTNNAATDFARLRFSDDGAATLNFDQWQFDGGPLAVVVPEEPAEFDSGLLNFITSMGFITPASQFFFSIILVGITTVTTGVLLKFMNPSRMKLIVVLSVTAIVGAFCAILQLFDLWMYLLAVVLAGAIVKGSGEFRNTWREIRENLANKSRVLDENGVEQPQFPQPQQPVQAIPQETPEAAQTPQGEA